MKHLIFMGTWLSCASFLYAQSEQKPVTIRIKKIENVNGVEKVSDTTFTTTDAASYKLQDNTLQTIHWNETDRDGKKIIRIEESTNSPEIIIDNENGGPVETFTINSLNEKEGIPAIKEIIINDANGKMDSEKLMKELDVQMQDIDGKSEQKHQAIIITSESDAEGNEKENKVTKIIILKKVMISEPSAEDAKMLNKQTGISDEKLQVENMKFFPNPNDGKFNLEFEVPSKGDTELNILTMEGKSIYNENLKNFGGKYSNTINISDQPKGVYFVKIKQGKHAQVKKIVLE